MPRYILDTNILTDLENPEPPSYHIILNKLASLPEESEVFFSILTAYEYQHGISKAAPDIAIKLKKAWRTFLVLFEILPLTLEAASIFGELKAKYEKHTGIKKKELNRHTVDFILAGTALDLDAVIVSEDKIFKRIQEIQPNLKVENWRR